MLLVDQDCLPCQRTRVHLLFLVGLVFLNIFVQCFVGNYIYRFILFHLAIVLAVPLVSQTFHSLNIICSFKITSPLTYVLTLFCYIYIRMPGIIRDTYTVLLKTSFLSLTNILKYTKQSDDQLYGTESSSLIWKPCPMTSNVTSPHFY